MNDKCAGGTGAVIDKINAKLRIPAEQLCEMGYIGLKLHPVAGKCGVFAETDINGLQKSGVPPPELMASLFEAIVQQNLAVLTRGNTLRPQVLLLGGPNTLHQGHARLLEGEHPQNLGGAQIPAARRRRSRGADPRSRRTRNTSPPSARLNSARTKTRRRRLRGNRAAGLVHQRRPPGREDKSRRQRSQQRPQRDLAAFKERYRPKKFVPRRFHPASSIVEGFIGIDGGSTSTKAVVHRQGQGNPAEVLSALQGQSHRRHQGHVRQPRASRSTSRASR